MRKGLQDERAISLPYCWIDCSTADRWLPNFTSRSRLVVLGSAGDVLPVPTISSSGAVAQACSRRVR